MITKVNAAAMDAGIAALQKANRELTAELDNLRNDLTNQLGNWEGDSREQYQAVQNRWNKQAQRNAAHIATTRQALDTIKMKYISNEKRVTGRWAQ